MIFQKAESSLRFYKGCKGKNDAEIAALKLEFATLKATAHEKKTDETISLKDICEFKRIFSATFSLIKSMFRYSTIYIVYYMHYTVYNIN